MADVPAKSKRTVFVIMPFRETPLRNGAALDEFYRVNLKAAIEAAQELAFAYVVRRSDDAFDITAQIIRDLYEADIVICDLSGPLANPNVMYELGVRLSLTDKPVILIREAGAANQRIFDIQGFYIHEYDPLRYRALEKHVIEKIAKFESGAEQFESPVFKVLRDAPSIVREITRRQAISHVDAVDTAITMLLRIAASRIEEFLNGKISTHPGDDFFEILEYLLAHTEELRTLPWHELKFRPNQPPQLSSFLTALPLQFILPRPHAVLMNTFTSEFANWFFADRSIWDSPSLRVIAMFVHEGINFVNALRYCHEFMTADASKKPEALQKIVSTVENSNLVQSVLQHPAGGSLEEIGIQLQERATGDV